MGKITKTKKLKMELTELERRQQEALKRWQKELRHRKATLTPTTGAKPTLCWELFYDELALARQLGLEETLRALCWEAAGRFANPAMLRSGMRYYVRGGEEWQ